MATYQSIALNLAHVGNGRADHLAGTAICGMGQLQLFPFIDILGNFTMVRFQKDNK